MPTDTSKYPKPTKTLTRQTLLDTWSSSRDSGRRPGAAGVDGLSALQFKKKLSDNIARLVDQLNRGQYFFSKLRPFSVPKKNGEDRVICIPTVTDRLVQRAVVNHLTKSDRLRILNEVSYGFVRGRGVKDAVQTAIHRRKEKEWVLKTDIQSFFDQIDRNSLKNRIEIRLRRNSLVPIMHRAIDCEISEKSRGDRNRIRQKGIVPGLGLRQGMPLSPLLSNFVLSKFDKSATRKGFDLIRYADDLILFGSNRRELELGYKFLHEELNKLGHSIPEPGKGSKTEIVSPKKPVEFLGIEIVHKSVNDHYVARIPKSTKLAILDEISTRFSFSKALTRYPTFADYCSGISTVPASYRNAFWYADDWKNFEFEVIGACNKALAKIFNEIFGEKVISSLSPQIRKFLGITKITENS